MTTKLQKGNGNVVIIEWNEGREGIFETKYRAAGADTLKHCINLSIEIRKLDSIGQPSWQYLKEDTDEWNQAIKYLFEGFRKKLLKKG